MNLVAPKSAVAPPSVHVPVADVPATIERRLRKRPQHRARRARPVLPAEGLAEAIRLNEDMLDGLTEPARIALDNFDLRGLNLRGACLVQVELCGTDLRGVDLSGADLREAWLEDADLRGANLTGADLRGVHMSKADLRGANLTGAKVEGAEIGGARLADAILPNGMRLPEYRTKEVRALLESRGVPISIPRYAWNFCHWGACPLSVALRVASFEEIPEELKSRAALFEALFVGQHLRRPRLEFSRLPQQDLRRARFAS